ncbi:MAG TPA: acetyl-CoA hydrolase/transferase C-terminal domain-containing protein, partial [Puia sp.]
MASKKISMYQSVEKAMQMVKPGNHLFIQTGAAAPQQLIRGLMERASQLRDITIYQMHTEGIAPYGDIQWKDVFKINCFFIGRNLRTAVEEGRADYIPVFLSEIPALFRNKVISIDVALIHVSVPDKNGYCSLGVSVDIAPAVLETAGCIIAQVNPNMPRTYGDALIHISRISAMVSADDEILCTSIEEPDELTSKIAENVASLIEDGSTLQLGIGRIPNAVLKSLSGHRRLGIHTEMFSDGVVDLIELGVVTGEMKKKRRYKVVSSFMIGSQRLYRFVNDNPIIEMLDIGYVNDVHIIRQNPKAIAINCAIEIDLTGQVCADSIGFR